MVEDTTPECVNCIFIPWSARGSAFFSAAVAMIRFLCVSTCTFGAPLSPSEEHNPRIIQYSRTMLTDDTDVIIM